MFAFIAAVRLAREEKILNTPKVAATVGDAIALARVIYDRAMKLYPGRFGFLAGGRFCTCLQQVSEAGGERAEWLALALATFLMPLTAPRETWANWQTASLGLVSLRPGGHNRHTGGTSIFPSPPGFFQCYEKNMPCHYGHFRAGAILPGLDEGRHSMDTSTIISELEAERDRLDRAIEALSGTRKGKRAKGRTSMSASAKKRIGEAMRRAWTERKRKMKAA